MHEIILKLLRNTLKHTMEVQLELLCKLLNTTGKELDHMDAKVNLFSH